MGLFSKKKSPEPIQQTNYQPSKPASDVKSAPAVPFDADAYFKSQESKSIKGLKGIKESTVREKLEQMEKELAQRPEALDYRAYDKNPIRDKELMTVDEKLEDIRIEVEQRQQHVRYNAIKSAIDTGVEQRLEELSEEYDYLSDENYDRNKHEFDEAMDDEQFRQAQENDMEAVERRGKVASSMPGIADNQLEKVEEFARSDIRAKPIDLPDKIPTLSNEMLDRLTRQFEEKYGSLKESAQQAAEKETEKDNELSPEDAQELERLRNLFG